MLKIGVTGGIGSGKTLICRVFSTLGVPVYNADERARSIMNEDTRVIRKLAEAFGEEIIIGGKPDRKALASIVFNDKGALRRLMRSFILQYRMILYHGWKT
jgi:dephospho-CoA kinase